MTSTAMPFYRCHKLVRAAKIVHIDDVPGGKLLTVTVGSGNISSIEVDAAWLTRNPALSIGGYFVEYQEGDKYTSYSPAAPFEGGYTLAVPPAISGVTMRAKMQVQSSVPAYDGAETVTMAAVCGSGSFGPDGESEDNTFARYTPSGGLELTINNPNLTGRLKPGQKFYLDFTETDIAPPETPPVDNAHVADGCEKFDEPDH